MRPIPQILLMPLVAACSREPPPCPPEADRFRPSVGVEGATVDHFESGEEADSSRYVGAFAAPCPLGLTYGEATGDTGTLDTSSYPEFAFATCNAPGWCGAEFYLDPPTFYCVLLLEAHLWQKAHCPECPFQGFEYDQEDTFYYECTP